MFKDIALHLLKSPMLYGIIVSILAQVGKQYGITIDQAGLTNDLVSLVGLAVSVGSHVKFAMPQIQAAKAAPPASKPLGGS